MAADDKQQYVTSLFHASETFYDQAGFNWDAIGDVEIDELNGSIDGGGCLFSGGFLVAEEVDRFNFGLDDFTVEFFVLPITIGGYQSLFYTGEYNTLQLSSRINPEGKIETFIGSGTNAYGLAKTTMSLESGQIYFISICSKSGVITTRVNGVAGSSKTNSTPISSNAKGYIGCQYYLDTPTGLLSGWIYELRVTKGFCRYDSNHSIPSEKFELYKGHISGEVKVDEIPLSTKICIINASTGEVITSTDSDASGSFDVELNAYINDSVIAVCIPPPGYKALTHGPLSIHYEEA